MGKIIKVKYSEIENSILDDIIIYCNACENKKCEFCIAKKIEDKIHKNAIKIYNGGGVA